MGANNDIQTTGDMSNSGAIVARNALNIDAGGTVTNRLGDISGGNVAISAVGDVLTFRAAELPTERGRTTR